MQLVKVFLFYFLFLLSATFAAYGETLQALKMQSVVGKKNELIYIDSDKKVQFSAPVPSGSDREGFKAVRSGPYVLVSYEYSDGEDSGGAVIVFDQKKGVEKWRYDGIATFNIDAHFLEPDAVYIVGVATVYKFDLSSGKLLWSHDDLDEKYKIDDINTFTLSGETVVINKRIKLDRKSGKAVQ